MHGRRDFQLVVDLDGFELHDPAAGEPGEHEVLGHLRLRSRRGARRIAGDAIVKPDRQIRRRTIGGRQPPLSHGQIEDGLLIAKLQPHALDEIDERRAEEIDHRNKSSFWIVSLIRFGVIITSPEALWLG